MVCEEFEPRYRHSRPLKTLRDVKHVGQALSRETSLAKAVLQFYVTMWLQVRLVGVGAERSLTKLSVWHRLRGL